MSGGRYASMGMTVNVHVYPGTEIAARLLAVEGRIKPMVSLEGGGTDVTLFADRPDVVRLRDALSALISELDAVRAAQAESPRTNVSAA